MTLQAFKHLGILLERFIKLCVVTMLSSIVQLKEQQPAAVFIIHCYFERKRE